MLVDLTASADTSADTSVDRVVQEITMGWFDRVLGRGADDGPPRPEAPTSAPRPPVSCPRSGVRQLSSGTVEVVVRDGRLQVAGDSAGSAGPTAPTARLSAHRGGPDFLRAAVEAFPTTGLWPIVLEGVPDDGPGDLSWLADVLDEGDPSVDDVAGLDPAALMATWWDQQRTLGSDGTYLWDEQARDWQWFDTHPGLARLSDDLPTDYRAWQDTQPDGVTCALVSVPRPADVPAALGWYGAVNADQSGAELSAVLRSWEDRFGAVLVSLGWDTLTVIPTRRPADRDERLVLAAEHMAFCGDVVSQGLGTIPAYADSLTDQPAWNFWWD